MRQRTRLLPLVLAAGLALGALPVPATASGSVPFSGRDSGHFDVPAVCPDGVLILIAGAGRATQLGHYAYTSSECFNPVTGAFAGTPRMTAANGDAILGSYTGQVSATADPDVITYEETLTITGGTGRFEGATGEVRVLGWANLATGDYGQSWTGTISPVGANGR